MSGKTLQKLVNAGAMKVIVPFKGSNAVAYLKDGKLLAWDTVNGEWVHRDYK